MDFIRPLLVLVLVAALLYRPDVHPSKNGYAAIRKGVLLDQAAAAQKGGVLLIGDSITERTPVGTLCGLPVFNAGISGAGVDELRTFAGKLAQTLKPRLTIIAVGVNDAQRERDAPSAAAFREIDRELGGASYVLPLMPEKAGQFGMTYFDPARVRQVRADILSLHRPTLRPFDVTGHTLDGVHLDAAAKAVWRKRLATLCH